MAVNSPTKEDRATGKRWGHGTCWSIEEQDFVRQHQHDMTPTEIAKALNRPRMSVYHKLSEIRQEVVEVPPVKEPGQYIEVLHSYVAEDFELAEIWARWNGYATVKILKRDAHMMCTILCTAK